MPAQVFNNFHLTFYCLFFFSETDYNAMDFQYWANLGSDIMIKSNINNWITCSEGNGSLVNWRSGSLKCKIDKRVTKKCSEVVPSSIMVRKCFVLENSAKMHFTERKQQGTVVKASESEIDSIFLKI